MTRQRITNFGVELEVLNEEDAGGTTEEYHDCGCEHCSMCGDYVEIEREGSLAWEDFVHAFRSHGLITGDQHAYHCRCSTCGYNRDWPLMAFQSDPTVGIEFVSRILNSDTELDQLDLLVEAYDDALNATGWLAQSDSSCGNHIHVSRKGTDNGGQGYSDTRMTQAHNLCAALLQVGTWDQVAAGGASRLRGYNGCKPTKNGFGVTDGAIGGWATGWTALKSNTMEFRLWNTPRIPERIKAHVGISIGMLRWAHTQIAHTFTALSELTADSFTELALPMMDDIRSVVLNAIPRPLVSASEEALDLWQP